MNKEYLKRFRTETIYLWDDQEETYVKSVPGPMCFAKLPGGKEFEMKPDNDIVIRAMSAGKEVTEQEYNNA